jgi:RimJ/RimL family protein N-acetyltransferase
MNIKYKTYADIPKPLLDQALADKFISRHIKHVDNDRVCGLIVSDEKVAGFFLPFKARQHGYKRMGVVYISEEFRNKGLALSAIRQYVGKDKAKACIAENNLASQALFASAGFEKVTGSVEKDKHGNISNWWVYNKRPPDEMDFTMVVKESDIGFANLCVDSIVKHIPKAQIYMLCLDPETYFWAMKNPSPYVFPTKLKNLEHAFVDLKNAKNDFSAESYKEACKVFFTSYTFSYNGEDILTYLDPKTLFSGSPLEIEKLFENYSLMVPPYVDNQKELKSFTCRYDGRGMAILTWWQSKILETKDLTEKYFEELYGNLPLMSNISISTVYNKLLGGNE